MVWCGGGLSNSTGELRDCVGGEWKWMEMYVGCVRWLVGRLVEQVADDVVEERKERKGKNFLKGGSCAYIYMYVYQLT